MMLWLCGIHRMSRSASLLRESQRDISAGVLL